MTTVHHYAGPELVATARAAWPILRRGIAAGLITIAPPAPLHIHCGKNYVRKQGPGGAPYGATVRFARGYVTGEDRRTLQQIADEERLNFLSLKAAVATVRSRVERSPRA